MYTYDTPEIGANAKSEEEKKEGKKCKAALQNLILNKLVWVNFLDESEKYGRSLVEIWVAGSQEKTEDDLPITNDVTDEIVKSLRENDKEKAKSMGAINVNQWMIDNTICSEYYGGKKRSFEEMKEDFLERKKKKKKLNH